MMEKPCVRTDLALEASSERLTEELQGGIRRRNRREGGVELFEVEVRSAEAANALGKPMGDYLTLGVGRVWEDSTEVFRSKVELFAREMTRFLPEPGGLVLLVGLGNRHITADAVGPMTMEHVLVTRHLKERQKELYDSLSLSCAAAITPGVLGETGIESADIIHSLVRRLSPSLVVAVDALASRSLSRLATTVQISTAGISPGSGVGNHRHALCEETLGVPVCAIGVPTVVDAVTLAWDVLQSAGEIDETGWEKIQENLQNNGLNFFVAPKETDEILKEVSRLIGYGINLALHPSLSYDEMVSLVG